RHGGRRVRVVGPVFKRYGTVVCSESYGDGEMSTVGAQVSPEKILQTGLAFWGSKTLLSAVELGLFTTLAEKPATADDLRARLGLHPRAALDFFDTLVALGFL